MKLLTYDIVFQEIPDEVTLALNLSGCPYRCFGCHSPHLQEETGEELTENLLTNLMSAYGQSVTCICFMGGDNDPEKVLNIAKYAKQFQKKIAWYSGNPNLYKDAYLFFDYIKTGQYIQELGALNSQNTNQRFYRIENQIMIDITEQFKRND